MTPPAEAPSVPAWVQRGKLRWVWGLWEPLMLYQRSAHVAPYSPGNSHWAREWYLRMHSEEIVAKLADMGVNCISTHYYKGFGVRAEAEEMERAARFTELCHKRGIRVLGYHQWSTICYETFLDEVPHAESWVQLDADGRKRLYGGSTYWRWLGCQRREEYVAYLREVVRRCVAEAKMDGVEWDGTVYKCHCELCQAAFREYLERKFDGSDIMDRFGIPHFRHVRIPSTSVRHDPLFQELIEFRRDFMDRRLREYNELIKSINPEAVQATYAGDPAPRGPMDSIDIVVYEHHDFPHVRDGVLTTQFRGLKHGFALDRVVLSTGWLRAPSQKADRLADSLETEAEVAAFGAPVGGLRRPETAAEIKLDLAEMAIFGGHIICPTWATRSAGGAMAAFEDPALEQPLRLYLDFFRRHEALYDIRGSLANVAVLHSRGSVTLDYFSCYPCVIGVEQVCLQSQIPFDTVFSYQLAQLDQYDALVLAEQTCLSDAEIEALRRFAESGGGLVVTGRTGIYDEHRRMRRTHPLKSLFDLPRVVFFPDNPERLGTPERDHPPAYHDFRLPERSDEIADAIVTAAGGALPCEVEANRFVGVDYYLLKTGERALHIINYDNQEAPTGAAITLPNEPATTRHAKLITPDASPEEREIRVEDRIIVQDLDTYAILVLPA